MHTMDLMLEQFSVYVVCVWVCTTHATQQSFTYLSKAMTLLCLRICDGALCACGCELICNMQTTMVLKPQQHIFGIVRSCFVR